MPGGTERGRRKAGRRPSVPTLPAAVRMLLAVGAAGCGAPGAAPPDAGDEIADAAPDIGPDFGEIPDGHVLFVMSYRGADVAGTISPELIYAQEFIVEGWPDGAGGVRAGRRHEWVQAPAGILAPAYLEWTFGARPPCPQCTFDITPETLSRGVVYQIHSGPGQGVVFDWDGVLWDQVPCADRAFCLDRRPAPPGRYTVDFCFSYSHVRCSDGYDCRIGDRECRPVEFDYPDDRIVWYVHDCSEADEPGEFPEACL